MSVPVFAAGNYRYIKAFFQYSAGVAAEPGYEIERARFAAPLPLADAYAAVEAHLKVLGRPTTAFAACELRAPEQFTDQGFIDFNRVYVKTLERWGIYRDGAEPVNPVARTNVCPAHYKPAGPAMYAFSYTVPARNPRPTFIVSGAGEVRAKGSNYAERIVRLNDTSPAGMREKVACVIEEMERRLAPLGFSWADADTTQAYTVQDIGPLVGEMLDARGAMRGGLVWHYAWPPVIGLDYEMDVLSTAREIVL
jgi:hypothetical protein